MHFILASGSPRRKEILEELGYLFEIKTGDFDESTVALDDPKEGLYSSRDSTLAQTR